MVRGYRGYTCSRGISYRDLYLTIDKTFLKSFPLEDVNKLVEELSFIMPGAINKSCSLFYILQFRQIFISSILGGGTPKVAVELLTPGSGNTGNSVYIKVCLFFLILFVSIFKRRLWWRTTLSCFWWVLTVPSLQLIQIFTKENSCFIQILKYCIIVTI